MAKLMLVIESKLTATQKTILETIARAAGRSRSFEGAQLRAARVLCDLGYIEGNGRTLGYTLTKAGEDYARKAGWLEAKPAREVTSRDVLELQVKEQHARTLRTAEVLLSEIESFAAKLREGSGPSTAPNPSTFAFLVADHSKLLTLQNVLEMVGED